MRVSDLLSHKGHDVATIGPTALVGEAVDQLRDLSIGALVVVDESGPVGIISERDIVRALVEESDLRARRVDELMSTDLSVGRPDTSIEELMTIMTEHRIRHVPVVDNHELCGIISIGDVVKARVDELERERRDLLDYVSAR